MITTDQVREALAGILREGALLIRRGSSLAYCNLEGDHLHNVPGLLLKPSRRHIHSYFTAERPGYLANLNADQRMRSEQCYGNYWRILEEYLSQEEQTSTRREGKVAGIFPPPEIKSIMSEMPVPSSHFPVTEEPQRTKLDWQRMPDSPYLFQAVWNGREIRLRLNDFPDEPLCTLLIGAQETRIDEFPGCWTLPRHRGDR